MVVFTFQTEGRYNAFTNIPLIHMLFLPFKQKADTTNILSYKALSLLFLPFKQKADTTADLY